MFINLKRIEFIITYRCSGKCIHCSLGDKTEQKTNRHVEYERLKGMIKALSNRYPIESVMCFGGEPLLYPEEVCGIFYEAYQSGIGKRQLITNGYFSKSEAVIADVVYSLEEAECSHILLSVDAFHQEKIPLEPVYSFAVKVKEGGYINIKLQPAWLKAKEQENEYNRKTREILTAFEPLQLPAGGGNIIFPAGNAVKYLSEYFTKPDIKGMEYFCGQAPYTQPLDNIDTISVHPNGDVGICGFVLGNVYREDINSILDRYNPYEDEMMKILIDEGVAGLIKYAKKQGIAADLSGQYTPCSVCREITRRLKNNQA